MGRLRVQQAQWNPFLFILAILILLPRALRAYCPAQCGCVPARLPDGTGGQEVSCHGRNLKELPEFPTDMISLDFSSNKLARIPAGIFPALPNLKSLILDDNLISHIDPFAFRGIHDYELLSLKGNKYLHQLTKYSLSGMRNINNLILTNNNISWIEKNAFYGSKQIMLLALYGNPLTELRPNTFNNLRFVHELRLPLGITAIIPGSFNGLSHVYELVLEGLNLAVLDRQTFFNMTNVNNLRIHNSIISDISFGAFAGMSNVSVVAFSFCNLTNLDGDMFERAEKLSRVTFKRNNLSKIQLGFPEAMRHIAVEAVFETNEAECCLISEHNLRIWRRLAVTSHWVRDFLRGVWCRTPHWVSEYSLDQVNLARLHDACAGVLDKMLENELIRRFNSKPSISELYKSKSSANPFLVYRKVLLIFLFMNCFLSLF